MEHEDREDDKQQAGCASLSGASSNRSPPGPILDPRSKEEEGFFVKHSQHSKNCLRRGSVSNLGGVVRKPHVPLSMADMLYALFTLLVLTLHLSTPDLKSLLVAKKNLWVAIMFHTA